MKGENINYEEIERELLEEHNNIRNNPKNYIPKLQIWLKNIKDNILYLEDEKPLKTSEGKTAVLEAINFLSHQEGLPGLEYNKELSMAAEEHVEDIGKKGLISHDGSDGSSVSDRIEKYTEWDYSCAENLDFCLKSAENIIIDLLVDDGVKERHHRENMFNENFKYLGVNIGPHSTLGVCTCFVYAGGIREIGTPPIDGEDFFERYLENTFGRKKIINNYQKEDPDAPDGTINIKLVKLEKFYNGVKKKITRKIYTLEDKTTQIIEVEEN